MWLSRSQTKTPLLRIPCVVSEIFEELILNVWICSVGLEQQCRYPSRARQFLCSLIIPRLPETLHPLHPCKEYTKCSYAWFLKMQMFQVFPVFKVVLSRVKQSRVIHPQLEALLSQTQTLHLLP